MMFVLPKPVYHMDMSLCDPPLELPKVRPSGPYAICVSTPMGDEIVEPGWDEEPTRIRAVDKSLLEACAPVQRQTVKMVAVK